MGASIYVVQGIDVALTKSDASKTRRSGPKHRGVVARARPKASVPGRVRAQRLSPEMRKQQLLACVLKVFSDKGLGDGKHADLAQEAAVSVPTTFHYFPTREDLINAALAEVTRYLLEDIVKKNHDPKAAAPASIKRILLAFTDSIESHPTYIRVWLEWSSSVRDGLWGSYLGFYALAIRKIQRILDAGQRKGSVAAGVDTDDAARIIVGLAHMITHMKFAGNSTAMVEHTIDSLLRGYLGARPADISVR
jgi:TetR/AcrR family hemagglutinin/protease transcriptional regulator